MGSAVWRFLVASVRNSPSIQEVVHVTTLHALEKRRVTGSVAKWHAGVRLEGVGYGLALCLQLRGPQAGGSSISTWAAGRSWVVAQESM